MSTIATEIGSAYSWEPNNRIFFRLRNTTKLTKLATFALQQAELEGVQNIAAVACGADTSDSLDGDYFNLETPSNLYTIWYKTSSGTQPTVTGTTRYVQVTIDTDETAAEVARKTELILDTLTDITVSRSGVDLTITNVQGGVVDGVTDGDTGWVMSDTTPGTGTWSQFGDIKDGAELTPEDGFVAKNTQKQEEAKSIIVNGTMLLTNFGERAWDIIRQNYLTKALDIALLDDQNDKIVLYYNLKMKNAKPMTLGEEGGLECTFNGTYQVKNLISSDPEIVLWDTWNITQ